MSNTPITVIVVEDHEITRLGLKKMLETIPEIAVIAEAGDGKIAVSKAMELRPDLILLDIGLPGMNGIEATREIKLSLETKVILITSHKNNEDIFAALSAGADAYCLKDISASQLATAIRSVMDGAIWLDPGIAKQIIRALQPESRLPVQPAATNSFKLSERELEVLSLLVDGASNHQMANRLVISLETVKTHMRHILEKLRVADRTQAAVRAIKEGLVNSPGQSTGEFKR